MALRGVWRWGGGVVGEALSGGGDVGAGSERGFVSGECGVCGRVFRAGVSPIPCGGCEVRAHASCSGLARSLWEGARSGTVEWTCQRCEVGRGSGSLRGSGGERCAACPRRLRTRYAPIRCADCGAGIHASCSGLNRRCWSAARDGSYGWRCERCEAGEVRGVASVGGETGRRTGPGVVEVSEGGDEEVEAAMEVLRERVRSERPRCSKLGCEGKIRVAKIQVVCRRCEGFYHGKCAEVSRAQLEGEVREGRWQCGSCDAAVAGEEGRGVGVEPGVRGGGRGWRRGRQGLRILQWNADGLGNKRGELEEVLERLGVDIAVIQETKWGPNHPTPTFRGFTAIRKDREVVRKSREGRGGGLLTLVRNDIPFSRVREWEGRVTEGLRVWVDGNSRDRLLITNVYRPPVRRVRAVDSREREGVRVWLKNEANELILGDLNLHAREWESGSESHHAEGWVAEDLLAWCEECEYRVLNDGSGTRVAWGSGRESTPDVSLAGRGVQDRCSWRVLNELGSDHRPMIIDVSLQREVRGRGVAWSWAWRRADWGKYAVECEREMRGVRVGGSVAEEVRGLEAAMLGAARASIPLKRVSQYNRPYWDDDLREIQLRRNAARERGIRRSGSG